MKIYEIIAEDYDNSSIIGTNTSSDSASDTTTSKVIGTVKSAAAPITDMLPDLGIDLGTLALTGITVGAVSAMSTSALSKLSSNFATKLEITQAAEKKWMSRFGKASKVFGILGMTAAITNLYSNLYVLQAMYVQGKITQAKFEEQREFEFGIFTAQVLIPGLTRAIGRAVSSLTGVKWLIRLLGGLSTTATLGATLIPVIATEAFIRWAQYWVGSQEGKDVIYSWAGGFIRTMGKPADSLWDLIMNAYQGATGSAPSDAVPSSYNQADVKKFGSPDAAKAAQNDKAADSTSLSGQTAKTGFVTDPSKDASGKLINPTTKITVTDNNGNLLPNARLMANAQLNLIRSQAIKAGQPDPLAKFAKPGQTLPPIR